MHATVLTRQEHRQHGAAAHGDPELYTGLGGHGPDCGGNLDQRKCIFPPCPVLGCHVAANISVGLPHIIEAAAGHRRAGVAVHEGSRRHPKTKCHAPSLYRGDCRFRKSTVKPIPEVTVCLD